jgi:hypothetical protein
VGECGDGTALYVALHMTPEPRRNSGAVAKTSDEVEHLNDTGITLSLLSHRHYVLYLRIYYRSHD